MERVQQCVEQQSEVNNNKKGNDESSILCGSKCFNTI